MLISLAVVPVSPDVWISNITDDDVAAFGKPHTTGLGSHLIQLKAADFTGSGLLSFERRDAVLIRRGRTAEAVLFRDLIGSNTIVTQIDAVVRPDDDIYWVTVGRGRQGNFEIGMQHGLWGVPEEYADKLEGVEPGDKLIFYGKDVGFALCEVKSRPFYGREHVWPDGEYPYRIRITPPLKRNEAAAFRSIYGHLRDRSGQAYSSGSAAGRAIGGGGGVFRRLGRGETAGLLRGLGW